MAPGSPIALAEASSGKVAADQIEGETVMKIRTTIKAGGRTYNHNEIVLRAAGLKLKTRVKAGGRRPNHNERLF